MSQESRSVLLSRGRDVAPVMRLRDGVVHSLAGIGIFSRRYPVGAIFGLVLLAVIIMALAAPLFAPYDPIADANFLKLNKQPSAEHVFGTDAIGRDVLSRVIYGARVSLFVAFMAVLIGDGIALMWGVATGYLGGKFDIYSQRFLELLMSLPTIILAMLLLLWLGAGIVPVIIAITITRIPLTVRVIRSVALSVREASFVEAARAIGASDLRIMALHVAPQVLATWLVLATAHLGAVIVLEASLGFLGVGIAPPTPTWGNMLGGAVATVFMPRWWLVIAPGIAITITVLAFNMFGDALRDRLDPKLRGRGNN